VSVAEYIGGVARLIAVIAPLAIGAHVWRRHLAPTWSGAVGALADCVGTLSLLVVLSELLGTFGQFRRAPLIVAALVTGIGSWWWYRRHHTARPTEPAELPARRTPTATDVVIVASSTALVLAQWTTWVARSMVAGVGNAGGPGNGDSLWYHMPFAAEYARTGWTTHLQYLNGEALVTYYPANTALLHAVGLLTLGTDFLSVLLNLVLLPIGLLAGWCIGDTVGVGPSSLAGVAVALTLPVVVASEAGTAKDDVLGLVGLLAAVAFVVYSERSARDEERKAAAVFGGLAAGLAVGSKLTLVAPVAILAIALTILTPKGSRVRAMLRWGAAATATGGYWYVRNVVRLGNPLPGLALGVGSLHLPKPVTPSMDDFGSSLLPYLTDVHTWQLALIRGLRQGLGDAWPVILLIAGASVTLGVIKLRGRDRVAPLVAVLALGAFVVTPGTVWAPQLIDRPGVRFITANLFAFNLRYMLPPVAIGLAVIPRVGSRWRNGTYAATVPLGVALAAMQLTHAGSRSWASGHAVVAISVGLTTVAAVSLALTIGHLNRRLVVGFTAMAIALAIVAGQPLLNRYQHDRFATLQLSKWAAAQHGARIGYSGFVFAYPLYGPSLRNDVHMVGAHGPDGSWHQIESCIAWRRQVRQDHLQYVVVPVGPTVVGLGIDLARWRVGLPGGVPPDEPPESRWTRSDPGEPLALFTNQGAAVYRVEGPATATGCT
jgi:hypothetical protein